MENETKVDKPAEDSKPAEGSKPELKTEDKDKLEIDSKPKSLPFKSLSGKEYELNANQVSELTTWALGQMEQEQEPEAPKEDSSTEEKIEALQTKILKMENDKKNEVEGKRILGTIDNALGQYDLTKVNGYWANQIKTLVLAQSVINPKSDITTSVAVQVKKAMEHIESESELAKKKSNATDIIKNTISGMTGGGGGLPALTSEKEWTADDLKSNVCRAELQRILEGSE